MTASDADRLASVFTPELLLPDLDGLFRQRQFQHLRKQLLLVLVGRQFAFGQAQRFDTRGNPVPFGDQFAQAAIVECRLWHAESRETESIGTLAVKLRVFGRELAVAEP